MAPWADLAGPAAWLAATLAVYAGARALDQRRPRWWTTPVLTTPLVLLAALAATGASYQAYLAGTGWLVLLLGPATAAFAVPIWEQRQLIRQNWPVLATAVVAGSAVSVTLALVAGRLLDLPRDLTLSLIPRSLSTPFAMLVSAEIGGAPELSAVFVIVTGVLGAAGGQSMLALLPLRTRMARGTMVGVGAHAIGTARLHQLDPQAAAVAGLAMILTGLCNVLAAPVLARLV